MSYLHTPNPIIRTSLADFLVCSEAAFFFKTKNYQLPNKILGNTELFCFGWLVSPAVQCSGGQVYQECGRACGDSCSDGLNCDDAVDGTGLRTCVPGCQCPPGLMQDHRGQCVPVNMCPCTQGGTTYQPGAVIQNSCNTWYVLSSSCMENDSIVYFF